MHNKLNHNNIMYAYVLSMVFADDSVLSNYRIVARECMWLSIRAKAVLFWF